MPSAPFTTYYQADLTIAGIAADTNGISLAFAAPSNQPDDLSTPPTTYTLETSPSLGDSAVWRQLGEVITGDDTLHFVPVPSTNSAQFFRLEAEYNGN